MKKATIGLADEEQIKQWKEGCKLGIYSVEVGGHIGYFREPEITDLNAGMATITKDNPLDYYIIVGRDTYIGGSKELFENPKLQRDFIETIKEKTEGKKGKLVNL
ncbi:MAG: hypothetical protein JST88_09340 [Bacteroidetes bacterium]|nr:hypothetical protein [Bacteroidota bacterium]